MSLKFLSGVILMIVIVRAEWEVNHLTEIDHEGNVVHMDVIHDQKNKFVMAITGDVSKYKNGVPTVNLHDYNTGYGVLKDINKKKCILAKALVPMASADKYRIGITTEVHYHSLNINNTRMSYEQVEDIGGPTIASFCKDYNTYFAVATPIDVRKRSTAAAGQARMWCIFSACIG